MKTKLLKKLRREARKEIYIERKLEFYNFDTQRRYIYRISMPETSSYPFTRETRNLGSAVNQLAELRRDYILRKLVSNEGWTKLRY